MTRAYVKTSTRIRHRSRAIVEQRERATSKRANDRLQITRILQRTPTPRSNLRRSGASRLICREIIRTVRLYYDGDNNTRLPVITRFRDRTNDRPPGRGAYEGSWGPFRRACVPLLRHTRALFGTVVYSLISRALWTPERQYQYDRVRLLIHISLPL